MNIGFFISKRVSHSPYGGFSLIANRAAVISIAVGLAAAIISFLIMRGFQEAVKDKVYRFNAHLLISKFTVDSGVEGRGFFFDIDRYQYEQGEYSGCIRHMQSYAYKLGLIKTKNDALGVAFKGVGEHFDVQEFSKSIVEGKFFHRPDSGYAKEVIISRIMANKLNVGVGDDFVMYFFQHPFRLRKLKVVGLYETNLSDYFDDKLIIGDLRLIQRINNWADSVVSGVEVYLKDDECVDATYVAISKNLDYDLRLEKTKNKYVEIFEWLDLIDRQVSILLGVIFIVVCVNMIAIVLIIAMERTQMIGTLKAIGASNYLIGSIFLYNGVRLITRGLLFGNALALGLCFIQYTFKAITLNPLDYYMAFVPVAWDWGGVLALNVLAFFCISLALILPAMVATRTDPIKAIRFD